MQFQSNRLLFREFLPGDYALFSSVFSNAQVMRYALMNVITEEKDMRAFSHNILEHNEKCKDRVAYQFAVFSSAGNSFIGYADIELTQLLPGNTQGDIGYFVLPCHWGNGYATEMAVALINTFFAKLELHKIIARCNAENLNSEKVMKKSGMTKEKELQKARFKNGRWYNELQYGILYDEWKQTEKPF
jgi:ribosomal-protein-alanine N-acetyltransferase